jgi:ABC-type transporter MlaC component
MLRAPASLAVAVIAMVVGSGSARADSPANRRTESLIAAFLKVKSERGKLVEQEKKANDRAFEELDDFFDYGALTSKALEPLAEQLTRDEQDRLKAKFRELIRLTAYPSMGAFFRRAQRTLRPEAKRGEIAAVPVTLRVDQDDLEVTLEVHWAAAQGELRIVDVLFDGDSLVRSYQARIGRLVAKSGVPGLFRALDQRRAELDAR